MTGTDVELPGPLTTALWEATAPTEARAGATVGDALRAAAASWPAWTALVDGADRTRRWTFVEPLADAESVAGALRSRPLRSSTTAASTSRRSRCRAPGSSSRSSL